MKGIYFILPVWGAHHVEAWLRLGLPSLLAPGNLPALAKSHTVKMLLCTSQDDIPMLFGSATMKALREVIPVRAVPIATSAAELSAVRYQGMNRGHNFGLSTAWRDDYGVIPALSDIIYADGALAEIGRQIAAGKRAVLTQVPTVSEERLPELLAGVAPEIQWTDRALTIPPRTLVRMTVQGLHPISQSQTWGSDHFTVHPGILYWPLGGHGFLLRAWHLYPAFVYPDRKANITTTIDGSFIGDAISDFGLCTVVDDSDRYYSVSTADSAKTDFIPREVFHADPAEIARWLPGNTTPVNREMIRHKIWIHDGIGRGDWQQVEAASDQAVGAILDHFARSYVTITI